MIKDILKINKPVLISTGVSDLDDIDRMVNLLKKREMKNFFITLQIFISNINTKLLSRIKYFQKINFISYDHSIGTEVPICSKHGSKNY